MKYRTVLITGGAGFLGHYVVSAFASQAERLVVLDNLLGDVHGGADFFPEADFPPALKAKLHCVRGDIRDPAIWQTIGAQFSDIELVIHLAALTGTGQSMNLIAEYADVNGVGTAVLLSALLSGAFPALQHVILAASRAIYGEGAYRCDFEDRVHYVTLRRAAALAQGQWNPLCPDCARPLSPLPTPESAPPQPASVYGVSKWTQEGLMHSILATSGIPYTALRFQNIYGPGQSLSNPYTGVFGVFFSSLRHGYPIDIFEDGLVTRDFIHCTDAARAISLAAQRRPSGALNIGSGAFTPISEVAHIMRRLLDSRVPISSSGRFRSGDIRHSAADISLAQKTLDFHPSVPLEVGVAGYLDWALKKNPMLPQVFLKSRESLARPT